MDFEMSQSAREMAMLYGRSEFSLHGYIASGMASDIILRVKQRALGSYQVDSQVLKGYVKDVLVFWES